MDRPRYPITATINPANPRAASWRYVFEAETVPLESPASHAARAPDGTVKHFYRIALDALDQAARRRLIDHIARAFGLTPEEVHRDITGPRGCPILADDVTVTIDARLFL